MIKKCIGCGSLLQTIDKNKEGYVSNKVYDKVEYCERCFKITHYGESYVIDKKFLIDEVVNKINKSNKPVLMLVDVLTINEEVFSVISKFTNKVYLVLSKKDLLPKSVKSYKLINKISELTLIKDVFVISSTTKEGVSNLYNKLLSDKVNSIYVVGFTNSGKSTLINTLLLMNDLKGVITTSSLPNTTLEDINIKLKDITLIDTPGFVSENNICNYIEIKKYTSLIPKKEIKPKVYNLRPGFMLLIRELIRIENNTDKNINLVLYLKNEINIEKMRVIRNNYLKDKEVFSTVCNNEDIVINGLGFIKVVNTAKIDIYIVNKNILSKRERLI